MVCHYNICLCIFYEVIARKRAQASYYWFANNGWILLLDFGFTQLIRFKLCKYYYCFGILANLIQTNNIGVQNVSNGREVGEPNHLRSWQTDSSIILIETSNISNPIERNYIWGTAWYFWVGFVVKHQLEVISGRFGLCSGHIVLDLCRVLIKFNTMYVVNHDMVLMMSYKFWIIILCRVRNYTIKT